MSEENKLTKQSSDSIRSFSDKFVKFISKYRLITMLAISAIIIAVTLVQSRKYLNPPINQAKYDEGKALINYSTIDKKIVDEISATLNDENIEVNTNFKPGRDNPFSE